MEFGAAFMVAVDGPVFMLQKELQAVGIVGLRKIHLCQLPGKPRLGRPRRNRQRRNKITGVAIHISSIPARDEAYLLTHVSVEFLSILSELLRSTGRCDARAALARR